VAWAVAYLRTKWHLDPSNHLATIHNITDRRDRQLSNTVGRTILQTITQKYEGSVQMMTDYCSWSLSVNVMQ